MFKSLVEPERRRQYGPCALQARLVKLHGRKHTPATMYPPTNPHTYTRARVDSRTRMPSPTRAHKKNTHTHKYVILTAFPRQHWFRERASVLRYTYIACLLDKSDYISNSSYLLSPTILCRLSDLVKVSCFVPSDNSSFFASCIFFVFI